MPLIAAMPTRCRVLVVDDNHDSADSLVDLLRAKGHVAFAAYDGQEAVEVCADWHPDLAILDVQMPRLDGCSAARLMRDGSEPPQLIASLTGMSADEEPLRSGSDVFDVKLSKPPRLQEIDDLLDRTQCDR
ncbi:response regulator [Scleromatobacter humisilvae]|uniref:Response regulator n=1 Tax=Scleromatobacter humisilvae TaxID=2897159 RepID=A0A9X1YFA9_9BURK|nr:response regulator [Scleromatobacter humisilvae]MCK9684998.1 response regulator [Scleromatobacter humisilvae]